MRQTMSEPVQVDISKLTEAYGHVTNLIEQIHDIEYELKHLQSTLEEILPAKLLKKRDLPSSTGHVAKVC